MSGRQFTPYEMGIILHHYSSLDRFPRESAPVYGPTLQRLSERGLIEWRDGIPRTTEIGNYLVESWLQTPLPRCEWRDGRDGRLLMFESGEEAA
jgi:hypothetical protein